MKPARILLADDPRSFKKFTQCAASRLRTGKVGEAIHAGGKDNLPNSVLIIRLGKIAYMIRISSHGLCGGNDFGYQFLKEGILSAGKTDGRQVEKSRYDLDSKTFSKPLKVRSYSSNLSFQDLLPIFLLAKAG